MASPLLGQGAYGKVYKISKSQCAKVFNGTLDFAREAFFFHEVQWLLRNNEELEEFVRKHIAIPLVLGRIEGKQSIAMDMHETNMWRVVSNEGPITGDAFKQLLKDVMIGVLWLHHVLGALWCDPKPDNVLIGSDGGWRIADFGIWRGNTETTPQNTAYSFTYRPPELLMKLPITRMDMAEWWAIGMMLDYANTGRLIFSERTNVWELVQAQANYVGTKHLPTSTRMKLIEKDIDMKDVGDMHGLDSPPDILMYGGLLCFDPDERAAMLYAMMDIFSEQEVLFPKLKSELCVHPVFPRDVGEIDAASRILVTDVLTAVWRNHHLPCHLVIGAITIMDSVLQQAPGPYCLEEMAMASVSISNSLLFENEFDGKPSHFERVMRGIFHGVTKRPPTLVYRSRLGETIQWMMDTRLHYRMPLGMSSWDTEYDTPEAIGLLVDNPLEFYKKHQDQKHRCALL